MHNKTGRCCSRRITTQAASRTQKIPMPNTSNNSGSSRCLARRWQVGPPRTSTLFIKTLPDENNLTITIETSLCSGLPRIATHGYNGDSLAIAVGWMTQMCNSPRNPTEELKSMSKELADICVEIQEMKAEMFENRVQTLDQVDDGSSQ